MPSAFSIRSIRYGFIKKPPLAKEAKPVTSSNGVNEAEPKAKDSLRGNSSGENPKDERWFIVLSMPILFNNLTATTFFDCAKAKRILIGPT